MLNGSILKGILTFSVPLIATNILQLLFNAMDVVVVGRFAGSECLAAVTSTNHLIHLFINLFTGMAIGVNVHIARKIGEGKREAISKSLHTAILFAFICGIGLMIFGICISRTALIYMNTPDNLIDLSTLYLKIYFISMPPMLVYEFGSAALRSKGDSKRPLFFLLLSGGINVVLNIFLVVVFKMTVDGVAIATVVSQFISAFLVINLLRNEEGDYALSLSNLKIDWNSLKEILILGVPAGLQSTMFAISNVVIQSSINSFGSTMMSGCGAASSVEGFANGTVQGLASGALTYVSQNAGAKKYDRIIGTIKSTLLIMFITCSGIALIAYFFDRQLIGIYSTDQAVIDCGIIRIHFALYSYILYAVMQLAVSVLRGLKYSIIPTVTMMLGVCGTRLLWIYAMFDRYRKIETVMFTYPLSWGITMVVLWIFVIILLRKNKEALSS